MERSRTPDVSGLHPAPVPPPAFAGGIAGTTPLVRAASRAVTRVIAGETLIVPISGGTADLEAIFTLNAVGSRIWDLLDQPVTPRDIVTAIVAEFDVTPDRAARDVSEFLGGLTEARLVHATELRK